MEIKIVYFIDEEGNRQTTTNTILFSRIYGAGMNPAEFAKKEGKTAGWLSQITGGQKEPTEKISKVIRKILALPQIQMMPANTTHSSIIHLDEEKINSPDEKTDKKNTIGLNSAQSIPPPSVPGAVHLVEVEGKKVGVVECKE